VPPGRMYAGQNALVGNGINGGNRSSNCPHTDQ
jgi:hypothetical protein